MNRWLAVVLLVACAGCKKPSDAGAKAEPSAAPAASAPGATPTAPGATPTAPGATPTAPGATPTASVAPAALPPVPERKLPQGKISGETTWLPGFKLVRYEGDAGASWLEAHAICAKHGREMCTEAQFKRACAEDDSIAKAAAWTMTYEGKAGFVVRGGGSCSQRAVAAGFEKNAARGALCCERSIAIETSNANPAFLFAVAAKLSKLEKNLNQRSASALGGMCDDELEFYNKPKATRAQAESLFDGSFRQYPDQWAAHGVCNVTLDVKGDPDVDSWTAECDKIVYRAGEISGTIARYVFGGRETRLRSITEPRLVRNWSPP